MNVNDMKQCLFGFDVIAYKDVLSLISPQSHFSHESSPFRHLVQVTLLAPPVPHLQFDGGQRLGSKEIKLHLDVHELACRSSPQKNGRPVGPGFFPVHQEIICKLTHIETEQCPRSQEKAGVDGKNLDDGLFLGFLGKHHDALTQSNEKSTTYKSFRKKTNKPPEIS